MRWAKVEKQYATKAGGVEIYYAFRTAKKAGNILYGHYKTHAEAELAARAYRLGASPPSGTWPSYQSVAGRGRGALKVR